MCHELHCTGPPGQHSVTLHLLTRDEMLVLVLYSFALIVAWARRGCLWQEQETVGG